jgi:hypothetical protein
MLLTQQAHSRIGAAFLSKVTIELAPAAISGRVAL